MVTTGELSVLTNVRLIGVSVIRLPFPSGPKKVATALGVLSMGQGRKRGDEMTQMTFCVLQENRSILRSLQ